MEHLLKEDDRNFETMYYELPKKELIKTCDNIIACYLIQTSQYVTLEFYRELFFFVCLFRRALNEKGYNFLMKDQPDPHPDSSKPFCSGGSIEVVPEVSNIFLVILFPAYFREIQSDVTSKYQFKFFGLEDLLIINLVYMIKFFCNWMLINNLVTKKLEINTDP